MRAPALLALIVLAPASLPAQDVLLRFRPPAGRVATSAMVTEMVMRGGPMAGFVTHPDSPMTRVTAFQTSTVTAVGDGEFTEEQTIDSARMEFPAAPHLAAMVEQMGDLMAGTSTVSRMSTRGRLLAVQMTPSPALAQMMSAMGQGGGPLTMGTSQVSSPSFWLLPEDAVRVGATWRDSVVVALDSSGVAGGEFRMAATYQLRAHQDGVATIGFDGVYAVSGPDLPPGVSFVVTGEVRLDLARGRLAAMTMEMTGSVPLPPGEVPIEVRTRIVAQ
jgi:hypothetical protein